MVGIQQQRRIFGKLDPKKRKRGKTIAEIEAEKKRKKMKLAENIQRLEKLERELIKRLAAEDRNRKRKRLDADENRLRKELAAISPNRPTSPKEFSNAEKKELANLYRGRKTFRAGLLTDPVRVRVSPPRTSPVRVSPPRTPPLMLRNIHGKERQYKKKVWYDKAVARNKKEIERLKNTICGRSVPRGNSSTLEFTNVRGKVRKYKKKGWFDRAVTKNKAIIQRLKTTVC